MDKEKQAQVQAASSIEQKDDEPKQLRVELIAQKTTNDPQLVTLDNLKLQDA